MHTNPLHFNRQEFSLERLESRALLSATPISFDPNGTLISGVGTINGVKYIQVGGGTGSGHIGVIPTGGGHEGTHARVFATDLNNDGVVDPNEITGIAVSANAVVTIYGDVNGDIVTNLKNTGHLSGDAADGSVLIPNNVKQILVHGSVFGNIISGHGLHQIKVNGSVQNLIVGTAANGLSFDFHGPDGPSVAFAPFVPGANDSGGGINGVTIGTGAQGLYAGGGGPSGLGGDISQIILQHDAGGVVIQAGNGGSDTIHAGGVGGSVAKVTVNNSEGATIRAGNGGDSTNPNNSGGSGGSIQSTGINALGPVTLQAGSGGSDTASNGHGGDGGDITRAKTSGSDVTITAGKGGDGTFLAGDGGTLTNLTGTISHEGSFRAGAGGDSASSGGLGGSVKNLKFRSGGDGAFIRAIVAGDGGNSSHANGDGGSIFSVRFDGAIGDFASIYGVDGMGGLFAGRAGALVGGHGNNGSVAGVNADRIAAIVAGTDEAPQSAKLISAIKANAIGANFDTTVEGGVEPGFDYLENATPSDGRYDPGEVPIDGPVIGIKIGSLSVKPLFTFETGTGKETGALDPHLGT